jgi:hypothetical protein
MLLKKKCYTDKDVRATSIAQMVAIYSLFPPRAHQVHLRRTQLLLRGAEGGGGAKSMAVGGGSCAGAGSNTGLGSGQR